jgi:hypothetical protein
LNLRPPGYEPGELPLLHPGIDWVLLSLLDYQSQEGIQGEDRLPSREVRRKPTLSLEWACLRSRLRHLSEPGESAALLVLAKPVQTAVLDLTGTLARDAEQLRHLVEGAGTPVTQAVA